MPLVECVAKSGQTEPCGHTALVLDSFSPLSLEPFKRNMEAFAKTHTAYEMAVASQA